jgi:hypothetical protein
MYTMKESVAIAKEADAKKGVSPTRSDNSIHRVRNEPERQLGSLRDVIGNIRHDGGMPSVESIATQLSGMHSAERAPALLALQQTHGNRYVQRVVAGIQAKLVVGQPGDKYEQEADRVAEEVMRMPEPQVQRQEEEEEDLIQTKPLVDQITPLVQRQVEEEEEEEEEMLQAKSREDATSEVTNDLESQINAIKGGGRPLAESERAFFEPRFGVDFSRVRVHTDARAAESARAVKARAFTIGWDIVFNKGEYAPETVRGGRLLAHELTHVIHQGGISKASLKEKVQRELWEFEEETVVTPTSPQAHRRVGVARANVQFLLNNYSGVAISNGTLRFTVESTPGQRLTNERPIPSNGTVSLHNALIPITGSLFLEAQTDIHAIGILQPLGGEEIAVPTINTIFLTSSSTGYNIGSRRDVQFTATQGHDEGTETAISREQLQRRLAASANFGVTIQSIVEVGGSVTGEVTTAEGSERQMAWRVRRGRSNLTITGPSIGQ